MNEAHTLISCYPRTFSAYEGGVISRQHALEITDAGSVIGGDDGHEAIARRAAFEEKLLPIAAETTPSRLRITARELAEQFAQHTIDERHEEEKGRRRVTVTERENGMADLNAYLPTTLAHAIHDRLTRMSKRIERPSNRHRENVLPSPVPPRRQRDEVRADLFSQILLEGQPLNTSLHPSPEGADPLMSEEVFPDGLGSIRGHVHVIIPHTALSPALDGVTQEALQNTRQTSRPDGLDGNLHKGLDRAPDDSPDGSPDDSPDTAPRLAGSAHASTDRAPTDPNDPSNWDDPAAPGTAAAMLAGAGAVDASTARQLAKQAKHWTRVIVNADTGVVLSTDRYRPTKKMRRLIIARDQTCRFPGCAVPAARCEIDHTIDAAFGGPTITTNLSSLCVSHHTLKHNSAWTVEQRPNGDLFWASPSGRTHRDRVPSRVWFSKPAPPDQHKPALDRRESPYRHRPPDMRATLGRHESPEQLETSDPPDSGDCGPPPF